MRGLSKLRFYGIYVDHRGLLTRLELFFVTCFWIPCNSFPFLTTKGYDNYGLTQKIFFGSGR